MFLSSSGTLHLDACIVGSNDLAFHDGRVDGPYATHGQTSPPTSSLDLSFVCLDRKYANASGVARTSCRRTVALSTQGRLDMILIDIERHHEGSLSAFDRRLLPIGGTV